MLMRRGFLLGLMVLAFSLGAMAQEGEGEPAVLYTDACPSENLLCQMTVVDGYSESSLRTGKESFEYFSGLSAPIQRISWWGSRANNGNICQGVVTDTKFLFTVRFFENGNGVPGRLRLQRTFSLEAEKFQFTPAYRLDKFSVGIYPSLDLSEGFVSIEGRDASDCAFVWMHAQGGDGVSYQQSAEGQTFVVGSLALSLQANIAATGGEECTPVCSPTCTPDVLDPGFFALFNSEEGESTAPVLDYTLDEYVTARLITQVLSEPANANFCCVKTAWLTNQAVITAAIDASPTQVDDRDFWIAALTTAATGGSDLDAESLLMFLFQYKYPQVVFEGLAREAVPSIGMHGDVDGDRVCNTAEVQFAVYTSPYNWRSLAFPSCFDPTAVGNGGGCDAPCFEPGGVPATPTDQRTAHATDIDGDWVINLDELLRAIQFYNSDGFHCETGTEDGFATGPGSRDCLPQEADYAPYDWKINLDELLRAIQFYNSLGYHPCLDGEDGFCAGS